MCIRDRPIIVENHTGASGTIGMSDSFEAPADGYTVAITNGPLFSLTPKYVEVEYTLDDFTMLRGMRTVSLMVVTNPQTSGFESFDDILKYGEDNKITYATSSGPGGDQYVVASAAFRSMGIEAEPVVLGSEAEVVNAIASGQVDLGLCTPPSYYAFQEEGTALAVATFYPEDVETKFGTVKCMAKMCIRDRCKEVRNHEQKRKPPPGTPGSAAGGPPRRIEPQDSRCGGRPGQRSSQGAPRSAGRP